MKYEIVAKEFEELKKKVLEETGLKGCISLSCTNYVKILIRNDFSKWLYQDDVERVIERLTTLKAYVEKFPYLGERVEF